MGKAVSRNSTRVMFWSDHPAGSKIGVAPPVSWRLEYQSGNQWRPVASASGFPSTSGSFVGVKFDRIKTRCLRARFEASGDGQQYAGVAVQEWEALAPQAVAPSKLRKLAPETGTKSQCPADPSGAEAGTQ